VVAKPAPTTPLSTLRLTELIKDVLALDCFATLAMTGSLF